MKIVSLSQLPKHGVLCHGCFDFLHIGHIRYLKKAARLGPLTVTLTADAYVGKGPSRPYYSHDIRAEMLAALYCVKHVAINHAPTELNIIEQVRPDYYCKGTEYSAGNAVLDQARLLLHSYGGKLVFLDDEGKKYSSTAIIKEVRGETI